MGPSPGLRRWSRRGPGDPPNQPRLGRGEAEEVVAAVPRRPGRAFTRPGIGALAKTPSARTLPPGRSGLGGRVWGRCRPAHARQASGRDADEIEGDQQGVVEPGLDHATLAIPPAGGEEGGGKGTNLHATTLEATDHRDVLHDGNIGEPAGQLE